MKGHAKLSKYHFGRFKDGREKARKTNGKARINGWLESCRLKGEKK